MEKKELEEIQRERVDVLGGMLYDIASSIQGAGNVRADIQELKVVIEQLEKIIEKHRN